MRVPQKPKSNKRLSRSYRLTPIRVFLLLTVLVAVVYGRTLFNRYALDDELVVHNNPRIEKGFAAIPEILTSFYSETEKMQYGYRPVVQITFAIEYGIFGLNPFVSHLINLLLYVALLYVLFLVLKKLFDNLWEGFPLLVVLLFMAHPVHAEVVCSLKNRDELLSFLGGIGAVYFLLRYAESNKIALFAAAQLCLWLGFFSKLSALTFLGIIPLTLFWHGSVGMRKNMIISGITAFLMLLLFYLSRLMLPEAIQPFSITENPLFIHSTFELRFATAMLSLLFYIKLFIFPHPLLFFYGYDTMPDAHLGNLWVWVSLLIAGAMLLWALWHFKKRRVEAFGILFWFISISMFANMATPVAGIIGERFAFAAVLGFCILLAVLLLRLAGTRVSEKNITNDIRQKVLLFTAVIVAVWGIRSFVRAGDWYNHKTLFTNDIPYLTQSAKANSLLAGTLFKEAVEDLGASRNAARNKAKVDSALVYYKQSVEVYPAYSPSWNNMGSIYFMFYGDYKKAIPYFEKAAETDTNYVEPFFNLGYCYELTGDTAKAIDYYMQTLQKDSTYIKALSNLSHIKDAQGNSQAFFALNETIMRVAPASDVPYINISNHHLFAGDTLKAVEYMEYAFEKAPQNELLIQNLIIYYQGKGNAPKVSYYEEKLKALP